MENSTKWLIALGIGGLALWYMKKRTAAQTPVAVAAGGGVVGQVQSQVAAAIAAAPQAAQALFTLSTAFDRLGLTGYFTSTGELLTTPQIMLAAASENADQMTDDERTAMVNVATLYGVSVGYA